MQEILSKANRKERSAFHKIIDTHVEDKNSPKDLENGFKWLNRNIFEDFYRDVFDKQETYKDILIDVCEKLKIRASKSLSEETLEALISKEIMTRAWKKMTPKQKKEFEKSLSDLAAREGKSHELAKAGGVVGLITAGKLSGFSIYLLATSGLSIIAGLAGITLPFTAYTTLTSSISVILGPVGWVGAGIFAIWKISGANYKKLIPSILYIAMLRQKQKI